MRHTDSGRLRLTTVSHGLAKRTALGTEGVSVGPLYEALELSRVYRQVLPWCCDQNNRPRIV